MAIFNDLFVDTGARRRQSLLDSVNQSLKSLSPDAGAETVFGRSLGASIGESLLQKTMPDPELATAEKRNSIISQIDPNDPDSLRAGINAAQEARDPVVVGRLAKRLLELEKQAQEQAFKEESLGLQKRRVAQGDRAQKREDEKFKYRKRRDAADRALKAELARQSVELERVKQEEDAANAAEVEREKARKKALERNKALPGEVRLGIQALFGKAPDEEYTDEEVAQVRKVMKDEDTKKAIAAAGREPDIDTLAEVSKVLESEAGWFGGPIVSPLEATLFVQKLGVINPALSVGERLDKAKSILLGETPNPLDDLSASKPKDSSMSFEEFKKRKREGKV